jgi:hypothetical protein
MSVKGVEVPVWVLECDVVDAEDTKSTPEYMDHKITVYGKSKAEVLQRWLLLQKEVVKHASTVALPPAQLKCKEDALNAGEATNDKVSALKRYPINTLPSFIEGTKKGESGEE